MSLVQQPAIPNYFTPLHTHADKLRQTAHLAPRFQTQSALVAKAAVDAPRAFLPKAPAAAALVLLAAVALASPQLRAQLVTSAAGAVAVPLRATITSLLAARDFFAAYGVAANTAAAIEWSTVGTAVVELQVASAPAIAAAQGTASAASAVVAAVGTILNTVVWHSLASLGAVPRFVRGAIFSGISSLACALGDALHVALEARPMTPAVALLRAVAASIPTIAITVRSVPL
jgi:hypothetical protein